MFIASCKLIVIGALMAATGLGAARAADAPAPAGASSASSASASAPAPSGMPLPAAAPAVAVAVAATPPGAAASAAAGATAGGAAGAPPAALDTRIQDAKADVIRLNRDLLVLEEELLFPANTQVAVFVSMDVGKLFALESLQVKLDDKVVTNHLYTPLEVQALHRGGVQRVYLGNLKAGEHQIVAFFTGQGPHERDYRRGTTLKIDKGTEPKYVELRIRDSAGKLQPEFEVKVWQ